MLRTKPHYWYGRFFIGVVLILLAAMGRIPPPLSVLVGLAGFYLALQSISPIVRLLTLHAHANTAWNEAASHAFARASLPRRIYYLLTAVAEVDGPMTRKERETVRHFVLERFSDPVHSEEVRSWETQPLEINDRVGLAARIATGLDDSEVDTLFCWCCLVAFVDGKFAPTEHIVLQEVAKGLGVPSRRARMLFHLARAQFLRGGKKTTGFRPAQPLDQRTEALSVLGLRVDAKPDQIRRQHRELVKRFHPDAHNHLGPVAQREATERFQEIQRAYEALTTS